MKNKFLQNSKDILSRSFNPVKCKTSLRLAGSRLKLLRNKKEVQVKQMRREIAGLLESGQDQTARIRVEHVIREEKMIAAYDLLEIYCELIVARLPIIESQKNCPIDLKEAIASLVFAAPRCGDVPELLDVRKNFSAKYGKDFTTAAIELRPQCGVGRMLVEKLSATAPDGQTKIKILNAIANEHNVKWDPKSFEEKDLAPPSDLSSGPSRKQSELYAEPTHYEAADIQACLSNNKMHGAPLNFSQQDAKSSAETEKLASAKTFGVSSTFQPEAKLPALSAEKAQLFQGDSDTNPLDKQRWTMEFKDAASAAQVAAESAEQASMAARAAAELASHGRILGQYSAESYKPDAHTLKDEGPETHPNSKFCSKIFSESSSIEHAELQNEEVDGIKRNDLKAASILKEDGSGGADSGEYSQSTSSKYKASADINSLVDSVSDVDEYSRSNSLKEVYEGEMSMKEQSFRYEAETAYGSPEKAENLIQGRIGKQPSLSPSGSQSSISDDVNVFSNSVYQKFVNDSGDDTFVGIGNSVIHGEAPQTSFHESAALVFDKSDSDIDDHEADKAPTYDEQNLEFHLPSLVQESPELLSVNTDSWSPRSSSSRIVKSTSLVFFSRRKSSTDFPDNMTGIDNSELDDFAPMTFDDSGGETSESDEDTSNLHSKVEDSRDFLHEHKISGQSVGLSSKDKGYSAFSSDDELNSSEEMHWKRNQVDNFDAGSPEKFSLEEPSAEQPTLGSKESLMESKEVGNESSPENVERLNFGKLTGGFRHKAHNHLPFMKNRLDVSSSGQKEAETTPTITGSTTPPVESPKIGTVLDHKKSSKTPDLLFESDSDSSEEEESSRQSFGHKHAPSTVTIVKTKPSLGASDSIFGSDDSDNDEEFPKSSLTRKSHLRSGISRRTKVYPSSGANSNTKMRLRPEALDSDAAMDRKPTTSYNSETPGKSESQRSSRKWENQQPISEGATSKGASSTTAKSNFWEPSEQIDSEKASSLMNQEPEIWIRSEAHDFDVSLGRKSSNSKSPDTTQQEFQSPRRNTSQYGNSEQPTPAEMDSKPTIPVLLGTPEKPSSGKSTSTTVQDESSTIEEISNPQLKPENENPRTATSSKHDGNKKPSHVHPKLPDYDTLIQSLRTNHS